MEAYGTVMIGTFADGVSVDDFKKTLDEWKAERNVPGYHDSYILLGDDGKQFVNCVVFESKEAYKALADDPSQDGWWRDKVVPLLAGEPTWIDGTWP